MTGLELMRAIGSGDVPPPGFAVTLDMRLAAVDAGHATFEMHPDERHLTPLGTVHGGVLSAMLDSAMGCAVHTMLPAGATYTTLQLDVKFVRPVMAGQGSIRAEGSVIHAGRRTATAEGRILDADGTLYAHATTTCLVTREA
jgi:uncharacterized protein (TIGR00369 family)